jgi:hypothetical protein
MIRVTTTAVLLLAAVAGCTKINSEAAQEQVDKAQHEAKHNPNSVFSTQLKAIDKAKGVEQTLMRSAAHREQEIDRQSQE